MNCLFGSHTIPASKFEHLTFARFLIAQGRFQSNEAFLQQAVTLLVRLLQATEKEGRIGRMIEVLALQALALNAQGNTTKALGALEQALSLAEPQGYARVFLDEGKPMAMLLRLAHSHSRVSHYITAILAASGEQADTIPSLPSSRPVPLLEPLTEREMKVLRLLSEGASNSEIARQLVLRVGTVKKHVYNICGKLGVESCTQAIARARVLNLL